MSRTMTKHFDVVVVGAGQAGFSVCDNLRKFDFNGTIALIGEEAAPPYQRPPLSKAYLLGDMTDERLHFRPMEYYAQHNIHLLTSIEVRGIQIADKSVRLSDETVLSYDKLVLATGSRPVTLPAQIGGDLDGVYTIRNLRDADAIAEEFQLDRHLLVVGGGYIGLEAAAVAAKLGLRVTVLEAADRILKRVASAATSDHFRELHRSQGVEIREGVKLVRLIGQDNRVTQAELSDGSSIAADFAVVGIGIRPNQDLATEAGLLVKDGIVVDPFCQTSNPDIYAAGDCAACSYGDRHMRLESVGNAIDQAEVVAANIAGQHKPYQAKPWFWSDQYETKLQIAGLSQGYDKVVTRRSDADVVSFWYFAKEQLVAIDAVNDPRAYMVAKRLIEGGKSPSAAQVGDPQTDLKTLLAG